MLNLSCKWMIKVIAIAVPFLMLCGDCSATKSSPRTFKTDSKGFFIMDGKPFTFAAGELHYFRIPEPYWVDRICKTHAAGFNVIQTPIEWSFHEPVEGEFLFKGDRNVEKFIKTAAEEGMYVIVRAGPYIGVDRDLGGFPFWLVEKDNITLRTCSPTYLKYADKWLETLLTRLEPLLYGNGGPIIMIQVENDYGSSIEDDPAYKKWLSVKFTKYVKNDTAVLFTKDSIQWPAVKKGHIPDTLSTVGFGSGFADVSAAFRSLRRIQGSEPYFNSELQSGLRSYWGDDYLPDINTRQLQRMMYALLRENISFSLYMVHGGTNFGFTSGSHYMPNTRMSVQYKPFPDNKDFRPITTSYDLGAPISEEGRLRKLYFAIQRELKKFFPVREVDRNANTTDYGEVDLLPVISLLDSPAKEKEFKKPPSFEELGQHSGFVAYSTDILPCSLPALIEANFTDRATIIMDGSVVAIRQFNVITYTDKAANLTILVENTGRQAVFDFLRGEKGLISATINGRPKENWRVKGYPVSLEDIEYINMHLNTTSNVTLPAYFKGSFQVQPGQEPQDTFFDMRGWGKGVVYLNQVNLGRYWTIGPTLSLYVPGCYIKPYPENNTVVVLELEEAPTVLYIGTSKRRITVENAPEDVTRNRANPALDPTPASVELPDTRFHNNILKLLSYLTSMTTPGPTTSKSFNETAQTNL